MDLDQLLDPVQGPGVQTVIVSQRDGRRQPELRFIFALTDMNMGQLPGIAIRSSRRRTGIPPFEAPRASAAFPYGGVGKRLAQPSCHLGRELVMRDAGVRIVHGGSKGTPQQFVAQVGMGLQILALLEQDERRLGRIVEFSLIDPVEQP